MRLVRILKGAAMIWGAAAVLVVQGCAGKEAPEAPRVHGPAGTVAETVISAVANGRVVYSLPLDSEGPAELLHVRDISSAEIRGGVLHLETSGIDGHFSLFETRLGDGLKPPLWLIVEMSSEASEARGYVYWDAGEGFKQERSRGWPLEPDGKWHTHYVKLDSDRPVVNIRFDPSNEHDSVGIRRLQVSQGQ